VYTYSSTSTARRYPDPGAPEQLQPDTRHFEVRHHNLLLLEAAEMDREMTRQQRKVLKRSKVPVNVRKKYLSNRGWNYDKERSGKNTCVARRKHEMQAQLGTGQKQIRKYRPGEGFKILA
jgi:hypothetical protein